MPDVRTLRRLEIGPGEKPTGGFESLNIVDDGFSDHIANALGDLVAGRPENLAVVRAIGGQRGEFHRARRLV